MFVFAGGRPKSLTDAEDRAATKKEREAGKKIKKEVQEGWSHGVAERYFRHGWFGRKLKKLTLSVLRR